MLIADIYTQVLWPFPFYKLSQSCHCDFQLGILISKLKTNFCGVGTKKTQTSWKTWQRKRQGKMSSKRDKESEGEWGREGENLWSNGVCNAPRAHAGISWEPIYFMSWGTNIIMSNFVYFQKCACVSVSMARLAGMCSRCVCVCACVWRALLLLLLLQATATTFIN